MLSAEQAAALEALLDERLAEHVRGRVPAELLERLEDEALLAPERRDTTLRVLGRRACRATPAWMSWKTPPGPT